MGVMAWLLISMGIGAMALAGLVVFMLHSTRNHPANLSGTSRRTVRPLNEAVDRLERLVKQERNEPELKVIGQQAVEAARKIRDESLRWAAARDELEPVARREGEGSQAAKVIEEIDKKIGEATSAVEAMGARVAKRLVSSYDVPDEDSLTELVKRLESLGQSMDETNEALDVKVR